MNSISVLYSYLLILHLIEKDHLCLNKKFRIVDFSFGQMPRFVFDKTWINDGLIFSMHRDEFSSYLCGYIEYAVLYEKYEKVGFDITSTKVNVKEFVDFEILTDITNLV